MQLGAVSTEPLSVELEIRRRELGLLHLQIDRTALRALLVWDPQTNALRDARPGEVVDDSTPIMILHFWATWCRPCVEEFPLWRAMGPALASLNKGKVRIVHVALQNDCGDMASFVNQMRDKLPFPLRHFDRKERLAGKLRTAFDDKSPPLPITLLLDQDRIVRQVFIGSITDRRTELRDATARLMRLINGQEEAALHAPPKLVD